MNLHEPLAIAPDYIGWARSSLEVAAEARQRGAGLPRDASLPRGPIATIPIYGPLSHRPSWESRYLGWSDYTTLTQQLERVMSDDGVRHIVLDVDSPGGASLGCDDCAELVAEASQAKRVTAIVSGLCCSAAYRLAVGASQIVASRTGLVGSIGTYIVREDVSQALAAAGVTVHYITETPDKVADAPERPMTERDESVVLAIVKSLSAVFQRSVLRHRKVTDLATAFSGRVFVGEEAQRLGLIDTVERPDVAMRRIKKRTELLG